MKTYWDFFMGIILGFLCSVLLVLCEPIKQNNFKKNKKNINIKLGGKDV